jgi:hypothetical protein
MDARLHSWFNKPVRIGILLFLLAALPRLVYGLGVVSPKGFGGEMERAAVSLVTQGDIADVFGAGTGPSAHVAPLYAYFLALVYRVFGVHDQWGWRAQVTLAVIISSTCVALLPWLGRRLGVRPAVGYAAAVLAALLPLNLWVETCGSWEQHAAALCLIGLLAAFMKLHDRCWTGLGLVLATGLLLGLAALLSPIVLPAAAAMVASELGVQAGCRRRVAGRVALLTLVAVACLVPWTVRTYVRLGGLVAIRSNFGLELWIGNNPDADGTATSPDFPNWHPYTNPEERARVRSMGELAYMHEKQRAALAWIGANPGQFAALSVRRARLFWFPSPDVWPRDTPQRQFKSIVFSLVGLGGLVGLVWTFWVGQRHRWLLLAAVLGPTVIYLVTHVEPRYRYPTFLLTMLLSCQAFAWCLTAVLPRLGFVLPALRSSFTEKAP